MLIPCLVGMDWFKFRNPKLKVSVFDAPKGGFRGSGVQGLGFRVQRLGYHGSG